MTLFIILHSSSQGYPVITKPTSCLPFQLRNRPREWGCGGGVGEGSWCSPVDVRPARVWDDKRSANPALSFQPPLPPTTPWPVGARRTGERTPRELSWAVTEQEVPAEGAGSPEGKVGSLQKMMGPRAGGQGSRGPKEEKDFSLIRSLILARFTHACVYSNTIWRGPTMQDFAYPQPFRKHPCVSSINGTHALNPSSGPGTGLTAFSMSAH